MFRLGLSEMLHRAYLICALSSVMLWSVSVDAQKLDGRSLRDILSKQGFGGELQGKVTFSRLGTIKCNAEMLQVYYYTWEETNPPGRAIHFSQRLIFIDGRNYLGHYVIEDRPKLIRQDSLRFPYSEDGGNTIKCDQDGLPKSLDLNGQMTTLER